MATFSYHHEPLSWHVLFNFLITTNRFDTRAANFTAALERRGVFEGDFMGTFRGFSRGIRGRSPDTLCIHDEPNGGCFVAKISARFLLSSITFFLRFFPGCRMILFMRRLWLPHNSACVQRGNIKFGFWRRRFFFLSLS